MGDDAPLPSSRAGTPLTAVHGGAPRPGCCSGQPGSSRGGSPSNSSWPATPIVTIGNHPPPAPCAGATAEEAFGRLRVMSQSQHVKVAEAKTGYARETTVGSWQGKVHDPINRLAAAARSR